MPTHPAVETHGLTHVALAVRDPEASLAFVFFADPDGYEVEIWYELPTPVDPRPRARTGRPRAGRSPTRADYGAMRRNRGK